jgi:hypothetical protein
MRGCVCVRPCATWSILNLVNVEDFHYIAINMKHCRTVSHVEACIYDIYVLELFFTALSGPYLLRQAQYECSLSHQWREGLCPKGNVFDVLHGQIDRYIPYIAGSPQKDTGYYNAQTIRQLQSVRLRCYCDRQLSIICGISLILISL